MVAIVNGQYADVYLVCSPLRQSADLVFLGRAHSAQFAARLPDSSSEDDVPIPSTAADKAIESGINQFGDVANRNFKSQFAHGTGRFHQISVEDLRK